MFKFCALILGIVLLSFQPVHADVIEDTVVCSAADRACVIEQLTATTGNVENPSWRDQGYREIAKTLAFEKRFDDAIDVWEKIENPDTKALTIRGIGMTAADHGLPSAEYEAVFKTLREKAETITHPPSYAIALTYIAMAQAFAGDDSGAWKTAASMENDALRHKAYGETAEIQAEQGSFAAAMKSIGYIQSAAFRNKSYALVSKIMADQNLFDDALTAAAPITNAYKKAKALQYVLDRQRPRDKAQ